MRVPQASESLFRLLNLQSTRFIAVLLATPMLVIPVPELGVVVIALVWRAIS